MKINRSKIKNIAKRATVLLLAAALLFSFPISLPAEASSLKEEVVYVRLSNDGSVDGVYVVNSFELGPDRQITDYGNYDYVRNLSNSDTLQLDKGVVTINTQADQLYYEGFLMNAELPWLISIDYWLDGQKIAPEDLGGKSGKLKIEISTEKNPLGSRPLFDKYCLQIAVTLDAALCRDIEAPSGTLASSGSSKQISFLAFPGKASRLELTSEVRDFKMPAITIAGIAMDMDMDFDDADMSDIRELIDGLVELDEGVQELLDGIFDLRDGVSDFHEGTVEFSDGMAELEEGVSELSDGTGELKDGVGELKDGAEDMTEGAYELSDGVSDLLEGVTELDDGVRELLDGTEELYDGAGELLDGTEELYDGIVEIAKGSRELAAGLSELSAGADKAANSNELVGGFEAYFEAILAMVNAQLKPVGIQVDSDNYEEVILQFLYGAAISAARDEIRNTINEQYRDQILMGILMQMDPPIPIEVYKDLPEEYKAPIEQELDLIIEQMVEEALAGQMEDIKAGAEAGGAELLGLVEMLNAYKALLSGLRQYTKGIGSLSDGIRELSEGMSDFHEGLKEYRGGVKEYKEGMEDFYEGTGELAEGVSDLKDGTLTLLDGVIELKDGVVEFSDGMVKLRDGVIELFDGIVELHDGVLELHEGVIELHDGSVEMKDGSGELLDGTYELYDGVAELKDGTGEIRENTANLDTDIIDGIIETVEEMFGKGIPTESFVSEKNGEIEALQFVMHTEGIELPETEAVDSEPAPALSFWQRFIRLFGFGKS